MNRAEHLQWAKDRARRYTQAGDLPNAVASFISDMQKHPELEEHPAMELFTRLYFGGHLSHPDELQEFIDDFN